MRSRTFEWAGRAAEPARERRGPREGFTLVELLVALAVIAICLLGVARVLGEAAIRIGRARRLNAAFDTLDAGSMREGAVPDDSCELVETPLEGPLLQWRWLEADCGLGVRTARLVAR